MDSGTGIRCCREEMPVWLVEAEELLELLDLKLAADPLPLPVRQLQPETGELVEQGEQGLEAFGFDPPREVPPVEPGVGVDPEADSRRPPRGRRRGTRSGRPDRGPSPARPPAPA